MVRNIEQGWGFTPPPGPGARPPPRASVGALACDALCASRPADALALLARYGAGLSPLEGHLWRGQALYQLGRLFEAAMVARQGLAHVPEATALLHLLANCAARRERWAEAARRLEAALATAPEEPILLRRYADVLARAGHLDEAAHIPRRAAAGAARGESADSPVLAAMLLAGDLERERAGARPWPGVRARGRGGLGIAGGG